MTVHVGNLSQLLKADPRPCKGGNSNICVAEGCYGESCRTNPVTQGETMPETVQAETEEERMVQLLTDWWVDRAQAEIGPVAEKAVEYGPNSMIEVGRAMGRMSGRDFTDEEAIEVACMFYISGKLGRWVDAVAHGKRPTDDTLHDIGIYVKMAQRNRDVGGWPFAPEEKA